MYNALPNVPFLMKSDSLSVFVTDVEDNSNQITGYKLSQNYPNPFYPATKINYEVSAPARIIIKIYDAFGSKVATLVDEYKSIGRYETGFNASELSSGLYFYKLEAITNNKNSFRDVKKMILLK
ncbi:MAG: T9SS type A sorting domain-containing protein [Ignavibacterium sp.]|nr:T9SS type A sorting domain-containing protein [Ignavibacterium sp.]